MIFVILTMLTVGIWGYNGLLPSYLYLNEHSMIVHTNIDCRALGYGNPIIEDRASFFSNGQFKYYTPCAFCFNTRQYEKYVNSVNKIRDRWRFISYMDSMKKRFIEMGIKAKEIAESKRTAMIDKYTDYLYGVLKDNNAYDGDYDKFYNEFYQPGIKGYIYRKGIYNTMTSHGINLGASYEDFANWIGLHAIDPQTQQTPMGADSISKDMKPISSDKWTEALYETLKLNNAYDKDYDTFYNDFYAPGIKGYTYRKDVYDDMTSHGLDLGASYEDFASKIGLHAIDPQTQQTPMGADSISKDMTPVEVTPTKNYPNR